GVTVRSGEIRRSRSSRASSKAVVTSTFTMAGTLLRLREGAQGLLEPLLLGAVARPVAPSQCVLSARPDLPGALRELLSRAGAAVGRRAGRRRRVGDRGGLTPAEDALQGLLERLLHLDVVAVRVEDGPELP